MDASAQAGPACRICPERIRNVHFAAFSDQNRKWFVGSPG